MPIDKIILYAGIGLGLLLLLILVIAVIKDSKDRKRLMKGALTPQVKEEVKKEEPKEEEKVEEEPNAMKIVIAQGESIVVGSEGAIPCGEYTLESADGVETFNAKIGRYVKEYTNGQKVVLTEKQKVTAVSTTLVLR